MHKLVATFRSKQQLFSCILQTRKFASFNGNMLNKNTLGKNMQIGYLMKSSKSRNYRLFTLSSTDFSTEQDALLPIELEQALDEHIIGQKEAKRSLSAVLRDRWRRQQIHDADLRAETTPNNILLIGPSGCGKTELARRIAQISGAPFVKVVATKYTEVGFVGDDTSSMVNDLAEQAYNDEKRRFRSKISQKARLMAENHIVKALRELPEFENLKTQQVLDKVQSQKLDDVNVSIDTDLLVVPNDKPATNPFQQVLDSLTGGSGMGLNNGLSTLPVHLVVSKFPSMNNPSSVFKQSDFTDAEMDPDKSLSSKPSQRTLSVKMALSLLEENFAHKLIDDEEVISAAKSAVENRGIIFIDEFDKLIEGKDGNEFRSKNRGVQKELLSLMDGAFVNTTRLGRISTEFILFVASGAFHSSKPSDIMPELQGRLPILSELKPLDVHDLERILHATKYSLLKQQIALLETDKIHLVFTPESIHRIASIAYELNTMSANIGARRLKTVLAKLLEDFKFDVNKYKGQKIIIDNDLVDSRLKPLLKHADLSKYII
ncbi:ATP-dependent protease ATPase subunit HslU-like [Hylaeus volcanicus]|uniref:ATP-dependent protease ATPase subunit HslU-like n=1 Tax=Hylaeus volcanicus TaxID=313075 RepID=UPI0023B7B9A8|nr:ATP-dependent protease ATPase subunit HslU-like [Hylaeus volcanicus]